MVEIIVLCFLITGEVGMKGVGFILGKIYYYRRTTFRYNLSDSDTVQILIILGMYFGNVLLDLLYIQEDKFNLVLLKSQYFLKQTRCDVYVILPQHCFDKYFDKLIKESPCKSY